MRVFVTGATGFVGWEILRELRREGHEALILARNSLTKRARHAAAEYGAVVREGDVTEAETLRGVLDGAEAVIHLVGIISESRKSTFERAHTLATRNLVEAARGSGIRRFVHMSALGTRPNAISRYHQTKWAAEECVRQSSLDHTIFRPSLIYGPADHFVNLYARIIRMSPLVPLLGSPIARFQPVAVECVARAFVAALREPASIGRTLDLCGPTKLTLAELVDQVLEVMRKRRGKIRIPKGLAAAQAGIMEWLWPSLLGKAPPLNRDQLLMLAEGSTGDAESVDKLFRLEQLEFREGISRYLRRA